MIWDCSGGALGLLWDALTVLWECSGSAPGKTNIGDLALGRPRKLFIFGVFGVSRDTQVTLGVSRTRPLFPDVRCPGHNNDNDGDNEGQQ